MVFLKLASNDIRFLNIAYKIGQISGIVPFYKFETFSITNKMLKNSQATILIILAMLGTGQGLYYRFFYFIENWNTLYLIINYIKEFFLLMAVVSAVIAASFQNQDNWLHFSNKLQYLDIIFNNRNKKDKKSIVYLQLVFYFSLYAVYIAYVVVVWSSKVGNFKMKMFWFNELAFLIDTVLHFLIFNLALSLLRRYNNLNALFHQEEDISIKTMRKIAHISRILSETTRLYNEIFGWPLLFTSGKCVSQLLQWFEKTLNYSKKSNFVFGNYTLAMSCSFAAFIAVSLQKKMFSKIFQNFSRCHYF